jgi:hypothetical protein
MIKSKMNWEKLLSASFWIVVTIHIVVFTSIGLFTAKGWQLLVIFIVGLAVLTGSGWLLRLYSKRHSNK